VIDLIFMIDIYVYTRIFTKTSDFHLNNFELSLFEENEVTRMALGLDMRKGERSWGL
jgi:hypothetical protein